MAPRGAVSSCLAKTSDKFKTPKLCNGRLLLETTLCDTITIFAGSHARSHASAHQQNTESGLLSATIFARFCHRSTLL